MLLVGVVAFATIYWCE